MSFLQTNMQYIVKISFIITFFAVIFGHFYYVVYEGCRVRVNRKRVLVFIQCYIFILLISITFIKTSLINNRKFIINLVWNILKLHCNLFYFTIKTLPEHFVPWNDGWWLISCFKISWPWFKHFQCILLFSFSHITHIIFFHFLKFHLQKKSFFIIDL